MTRFDRCIWFVIVAVVLGDIAHAWINRDGFMIWEPHPMVRGLYLLGGMALVIIARLSVLAIAFIAARVCRRWRQRITWLYLGSCATLLPSLIDCLVNEVRNRP